jgi:hypothetical protein
LDFVEAMATAAFAGAIGCAAAMVIGDWMLPFAYTQTIEGFDYAVYNWIMIGVIPLLHYATRNSFDGGDTSETVS